MSDLNKFLNGSSQESILKESPKITFNQIKNEDMFTFHNKKNLSEEKNILI